MCFQILPRLLDRLSLWFTCVTIYNCTQSRVIPRHVLSLPCFLVNKRHGHLPPLFPVSSPTIPTKSLSAGLLAGMGRLLSSMNATEWNETAPCTHYSSLDCRTTSTLVLLFDLFGFSLVFFALSVLHTNVRGLSTAVSPGEQPSKTVFALPQFNQSPPCTGHSRAFKFLFCCCHLHSSAHYNRKEK